MPGGPTIWIFGARILISKIEAVEKIFLMFTVFTIPKPFIGPTAIIQTNAIQSWMHISPRPEIILCGDEPGIAETASSFGLINVQKIAKNELGTPLLDSAFREVQRIAGYSIIAYVNTDIIFLSDLPTAIQKIPFNLFLLCGQRVDLDLNESIDFQSLDWEICIKNFVNQAGRWSPIDAIDYFIFRKGSFTNIPAFAVGRPRWDNWMIYHARTRQMPVVDMTKVITPIHQNHGYQHVKLREGMRWEGPEANKNLDLAGGKDHLFDLLDATHEMTSSGVSLRIDDQAFNRRIYRQRALAPKARGLSYIRQRFFGLFYNHFRFLPNPVWKQIVCKLSY